jgi:hypothetical protein
MDSYDASDLAVYQVVASRRLQWDNLLWQVPTLSLTAQAFLFTIALGADTSQLSRCIAALLSMLSAAVSMILMAGQRRGELTDSAWLEAYELRHFDGVGAHGMAYKARRDQTPMVRDSDSRLIHFYGHFARKQTFPYWMSALFGFGIAAAVVFVIAIAHQGWLR